MATTRPAPEKSETPGVSPLIDEQALAKRVAEHRAKGEGLDDRESGARYRIFALALRPALAGTLKEGGTLEDLLKSAVGTWNGLRDK